MLQSKLRFEGFPPSPRRPRVLWLERGEEVATSSLGQLEERFVIEVAPGPAVAWERLSAGTYDALVLAGQGQGVSATLLGEVRQRRLGLAVVAYSSFASVECRVAGFDAGLDDFVVKGGGAVGVDDLCTRIEVAILRRRTRRETEADHPHELDEFATQHRLTPQERRLIQGCALGGSDKEMAAELGCSRSSISTYWCRIFRKTGHSGKPAVLAALFRYVCRASRDGERSQKFEIVSDWRA